MRKPRPLKLSKLDWVAINPSTDQVDIDVLSANAEWCERLAAWLLKAAAWIREQEEKR